MLYDISLPLRPNLPVWPGDPPIRLEPLAQIDRGDMANVSFLAGTVHIGTHIDAPHHFLNNGRTIAHVSPEACLGPAWVLDLGDAPTITADVLAQAWPQGAHPRRVLFKTRNSRWWAEGVTEFRQDYVALQPDGAQWLVERGVVLVGMDYLSIAPFTDPVPTHRILLEADVVILEGVRLDGVHGGPYELICAPLLIPEAEGAPARAWLRRPEPEHN
ncbi:MAG: cyclase family protein [Chloroflexi bacterium]|nr:cyclase family protein [Chloroflexota bacterium]